MAPLSLAIAVWGVVTGVAMVNSGMPLWLAVLMTLTVYAGSAQLAVLPLLAVSAPLPLVWVTAAIVNLRFVIFAAASRSAFVGLPLRQRLLAGYLNGDLGFALFTQRFVDDPVRGTPEQWGYFYGLTVANWAVWQVACLGGVFIGDLFPAAWGFELAAYLALLAVLVPMMTTLPTVAGVVTAVALSLLTVGLPLRLGLLVSVLAGVVVAMTAERWRAVRVRAQQGSAM
jgi:predicted branched-subunit amino acid permease